MNIQQIKAMPSISEKQVTWETSSQEARQEGSWHNSDLAANAIYAAQIERTVRNMENVQPARSTSQQNQEISIQEPRKTWKKICHSLSMACGLGILPSFALLAFGPLGLLAPVCLTIGFITLALLGGKPTEAIQAARGRRAVEVSQYDPR